MSLVFLKHQYAFASILTATFTLFLSGFIFFKGQDRKLSIPYSFWALCVGLWSFFLALNVYATSQPLALLWCRLLHVWAILLPAVYVHFVLSYLRRLPQKLNLVYFLYSIAGLFLFLDFSPWFISATYRPKFDFFVTQPLFAYPFHVLTFVISILYVHWELIEGVRKSAGVRRRQIQYFFIATLIGYGGGVANYLINYNLFIFPLYPFGNYTICSYVIVIGLAIVRYRFIDIEVIIRKTIVFSGLFAMVILIVAVVTTITQSFVGRFVRLHAIGTTALSALVVILIYEPLKRWLVAVTDRYLFQKGYSYEEVQESVAECAEITDLKDLAARIVGIFSGKMTLETASILLLDGEESVFVLEAARGVDAALPDEDEKDRHALKIGAREAAFFPADGSVNVLRADELKDEDLALPVRYLLKVLRPEILVRVSYRGGMIALLCLGKKKSDREFSQDDIRFLSVLSKQLANVINIAKIFHFQRDFYALQAEKNRIELVAQLSVGIDHEIKNPLNQILPRLQRILNYYEKNHIVPNYDKLVEFVQDCIRNVDRIISIMTRLRKFAHPVEGDELKPHPVAIRAFVEEAVALISPKQLEIDSIRIENEVPEDTYVFAEETSVVQVFYNLISNAYHSIDRNGRITIFCSDHARDGRVVIGVRDTGKGIVPEILDRIFNPFFTTKPTNLAADGSGPRFKGTGLGLSFVKKYMEDLGGTVSVSSETGSGATFYLKFLKAGRPG